MGGPRLELFRFASYVFLPVAAMAWYGNPEWYEKHVKPLRDGYLQPEKADVVRRYSDRGCIMFADLARFTPAHIRNPRRASTTTRCSQSGEIAETPTKSR